MTILTVRHLTTYRYRRPVALGDHRMMFRPRDSYDQRLIESRLVITPEPVRIHWIHDPFGNCVAIARFKARASELRFERDRKSTRLNSSHGYISYAVFCLKKKKKKK